MDHTESIAAPNSGAIINITVPSVRRRQSFVIFIKKSVFYTVININFSPVHLQKY